MKVLINDMVAEKFGSKKGLLRNYFWRVFSYFLPSFIGSVDYKNVNRVIFVCKGNICRSPLAEYAFKRTNSLACCSAGIEASANNPANERIKDIGYKYGVSLTEHKTKNIKSIDIHNDDLIVCMEPIHVRQIKMIHSSSKVVLLGRYGNPKSAYIHDPYNACDAYAQSCAEYIINSVNQLSSKLVK